MADEPAATPPVEPAPVAPAADPAAILASAGNIATDPAAPAATDPPAADPPAPTEPPKPIEYADLQLPEGIGADDPLIGAFTKIAGEHQVSQEAAQAILAEVAPQFQAALRAPYEAFVETQKAAQNEVKADVEIGGSNLQQSTRQIASLLTATPANPFVKSQAEADGIRDCLTMTGSGNMLPIVRLLARVGATLTEGGGVRPGNPVAQPRSSNPTAMLSDALYSQPAGG